MNFLQAVRLSLDTIWSNKLRSFLTMLGVIIGVFAVVALVSIAQGATGTVTEQVQGMGSNLITVQITGRGTKTALTIEEAQALQDRAGVMRVAPVISEQGNISYGSTTERFSVEGATFHYKEVRNHWVQAGRFLVPTDITYRQNVAILGTEVVTELFPATDPLGKEVRINGTPFTVVGVMEEKGSGGMMGSEDNKVFIPISTARRLFRSPGVQIIYVQAESPQVVDRAVVSVEAALKHHFRDEDAYRVFSQAQILDLVDQVTGTMTLVLGGIAGISLLVGGIGIMNIMLVSVTERTREIGICKALGAKRRDVLFQFMVESAVISSIGGIIGVVLGFGLVWLLNRLFDLPAAFSLWVAFPALLFSLFIGIFFGIYPANKAAKLNPIDALRAE
ncbi:MAG TPA: ABC transporter permease [Candidatus Limnocylindrales bacterium]|nr:ABC transporter permease [Candidatus Limnocylindrales bacterium]